MVRREHFEAAGGFDEHLPAAAADLELCARLLKRGFRNVYTPHAKLLHHACDDDEWHRYDSADVDTVRGLLTPLTERGDPFYNPNLSTGMANGRLRSDATPC